MGSERLTSSTFKTAGEEHVEIRRDHHRHKRFGWRASYSGAGPGIVAAGNRLADGSLRRLAKCFNPLRVDIDLSPTRLSTDCLTAVPLPIVLPYRAARRPDWANQPRLSPPRL
jgi:hypothetical protein